jgi:micrococcal nuclease
MYSYKVTLVRVVDGDTVDVDIHLGFGVTLSNERVRLIGIDTPESRTRDLVEKQFGKLATQQVEDFFENIDIVLVSKEFKGKFGRILGDFVCCGVSLCDYLVSEGYAVPYYGNSKEDIVDLHLKNRTRLIEEGKIILED